MIIAGNGSDLQALIDAVKSGLLVAEIGVVEPTLQKPAV